MTDSLDERLKVLEERVKDNEQMLIEISTIMKLRGDQIHMLSDHCRAYHELFDIFRKIGIIDPGKYKEEYERFLFLFKESEGYVKNVGRTMGLDF